MVDIRKGAFVIEYTGEVRLSLRLLPDLDFFFLTDVDPLFYDKVIPIDESYRRVTTQYTDSKSYYFLQYDAYDVIDAVPTSSLFILSFRFVKTDDGGNQIGIGTKR